MKLSDMGLAKRAVGAIVTVVGIGVLALYVVIAVMAVRESATETPTLRPSLGVVQEGHYNFLVIGGFRESVFFEIRKRQNASPNDPDQWSGWSQLESRIGGVHYSDFNVRPGVRYEYQVHALDAGGNRIGEWSDTVGRTMPEVLESDDDA